MPKDPVCGMEVKENEAAATSSYKGTTYYFCAPGCLNEFVRNPEKYLMSQSTTAKNGTDAARQDGGEKAGRD